MFKQPEHTRPDVELQILRRPVRGFDGMSFISSEVAAKPSKDGIYLNFIPRSLNLLRLKDCIKHESIATT